MNSTAKKFEEIIARQEAAGNGWGADSAVRAAPLTPETVAAAAEAFDNARADLADANEQLAALTVRHKKAVERVNQTHGDFHRVATDFAQKQV